MCGVPAANFGDGVGDQTWHLFYENDRPVWRRSAPALSTSAVAASVDTTEVEQDYKRANSVDGSQYAQAPAATCTEEERAFADEVPTTCRIHIRQEILSSEYEEDAHKTAQSQREEPGHAGFGCS